MPGELLNLLTLPFRLNAQKPEHGHEGEIHGCKEQGKHVAEIEVSPGKGNPEKAQVGDGVKYHDCKRSQGQGPD